MTQRRIRGRTCTRRRNSRDSSKHCRRPISGGCLVNIVIKGKKGLSGHIDWTGHIDWIRSLELVNECTETFSILLDQIAEIIVTKRIVAISTTPFQLLLVQKKRVTKSFIKLHSLRIGRKERRHKEITNRNKKKNKKKGSSLFQADHNLY
jgi:hypothetical protein